MTEQNKYRTLAVVCGSGLIVFLYQMAGFIGKIQSWEVIWDPPQVSQMLIAIAAALASMLAALGLDVPELVKGLFGRKE